MPGKSVATTDKTFLFVSFSGNDIDAVTAVRAPIGEGYKACKARALIVGAQKFHVYRVVESGQNKLEFVRVQA